MSGMAAALAVGIGFGGAYFGGLWLTVRRVPDARRPGLLVLGSYAGRLLGAGVGFWLVLETGWPNLLACLVGFLVARSVLVRRLGRRAAVREAPWT